MNLYKKILRLEKRIRLLEQENCELRKINEDAQKTKQEYSIKLKLAEKKELEYGKLIIELRKKNEFYQKTIRKFELIILKLNTKYKKMFTEIKNDLYT